MSLEPLDTDDSASIEAWESPDSSVGHEQQYANNYYDPAIAHPVYEVDDDLRVECPSHTTERKLVAKIDLRVIPFLSILYLLAFLDRCDPILRYNQRGILIIV